MHVELISACDGSYFISLPFPPHLTYPASACLPLVVLGGMKQSLRCSNFSPVVARRERKARVQGRPDDENGDEVRRDKICSSVSGGLAWPARRFPNRT